MSDQGLTPEELLAESATALPDKEVVSILDLNANVDVVIDAASPIDLAAAANLNVAAPIEAAASANVLSENSGAQAEVSQVGTLTQVMDADANATSTQVSGIDQGNDPTDDPDDGTTDPPPVDTSTGSLLDGNLLNVNVDVDLDTDLAAPISGAVAANANVAAPINAGVAANIGSVDSDAIAFAEQDVTIDQTITGSANATADQNSTISQGEGGDSGDSTSTGTGSSSTSGDSSGASGGSGGSGDGSGGSGS